MDLATDSKDIETFLKPYINKKIFVISGKNSYYKSSAKNFFDKIFSQYKITYYFKKSYIPELKELNLIISKLEKLKPELIIAIGGGCVMDYAKMANVLVNKKNILKKIINSSFNIKSKLADLVAIPTTAGSGAEVTPSSVVYINKIKYNVEHSLVKPDYYFLIPELIIGAPKEIKSCAGFDVISQAIESIISKRSNSSSLKYATKSLEISLPYFIKFLNNPNKTNTFEMSIAANLSGKAIAISKTTAPHAVSYPFTSHFNIKHGHAVSLTLNKFLRFNYNNLKYANCDFNLKKRFEIIFKIFKVDNINDLEKKIDFIKSNARLESNLSKLGINLKKDFNKIIYGVSLNRLQNNPVQIKNFDLKQILLYS